MNPSVLVRTEDHPTRINPPPPVQLPSLVPPVETGHIGMPMTLTFGQFAGLTVRFELAEIQQAEIGRKLGLYSRKDRRPLDPPPIVLCRIFRSQSKGGEGEEEEMSYSDIRPEGIVCHVDLFADGNSGAGPPAADGEAVPPTSATVDHPPPDKVTEHLAGSTFVQMRSIKLKGKPVLIFAFTDLSVRAEGIFWPRYRCFDIFSSLVDPAAHPVLAECNGGRFQVYSTNDFPGLAPSTELTQEISVMGIQTSNRATVRKRKRTGPEEPGISAQDQVDGGH